MFAAFVGYVELLDLSMLRIVWLVDLFVAVVVFCSFDVQDAWAFCA